MMDMTQARTTSARPKEGLFTLDYHSVAGPLLSGARSLADMVLDAREANLPAGITGAIASHRGAIRQWIEGPEAAVRALWDRVRQDPRHRVSGVEPLRPIAERHFPGSPMQLALSAEALRQVRDALADLVELPVLCADPGQARRGPATLDWQLESVHRRRSPDWLVDRATHVADLLQSLAPQEAGCRVHADLAELDLDQQAALVPAVLDELQSRWTKDMINGAERTIELALFQGVLRKPLDLREWAAPRGQAVVCLLPGVPDCHGAMVKVALLRHAGWSVRLLLPAGITEVADLVGPLSPDVLVLVGSRLASSGGEKDLAKELLIRLRAERPVPVILGGRLAMEDDATLCGARDTAICATPADVARLASLLVPLAPRGGPTRSQCTAAQVYLLDRALAELQRRVHGFGRVQEDTPQTIGTVIPFPRRPTAG